MKFSVTIPAYKKRYLAEAIESVLKQTYKDFELIIVDDCSPEDLKSVVDRHNDPHIRYYRNEKNCGAIDVVDNWNICLSYCTGDYIICMGDDDRLLPCCLEEYKKLIEKYPECNVYHAKTQIIDEEGIVYKIQESRPIWEGAFSMIYHQLCYKRLQFIGDFCYSAKWLKQNKYKKFDYAYGSDWATANIAAMEHGIANGQLCMFQYRVNKYTISTSQNLHIAGLACHNCYQFYKSLLNKDLYELSGEENTYKVLSVALLFNDYRKKIMTMVAKDLTYKNPFIGFKFWETHSKVLEINTNMVFMEFLKAIVRKLKKIIIHEI